MLYGHYNGLQWPTWTQDDPILPNIMMFIWRLWAHMNVHLEGRTRLQTWSPKHPETFCDLFWILLHRVEQHGLTWSNMEHHGTRFISRWIDIFTELQFIQVRHPPSLSFHLGFVLHTQMKRSAREITRASFGFNHGHHSDVLRPLQNSGHITDLFGGLQTVNMCQTNRMPKL